MCVLIPGECQTFHETGKIKSTSFQITLRTKVKRSVGGWLCFNFYFLLSSVLMEKLTSIEPKIKVPAGSAALKEEILKEMDAVNDTEEPGEEDEGN